eukprot:m51a1_g1689 hypothetical protein (200) ;mRNA; f:458995-459781
MSESVPLSTSWGQYDDRRRYHRSGCWCCCCWCTSCCAALCAVLSCVVVALVVAGAVYGGLAAYTVHNTNFDIVGMKIENFQLGVDSWSAEIQMTLLCNTTVTTGAPVRMDRADVYVYFEGADIGPGEFGPVTFAPGTSKQFTGTVHAFNRPLSSAAFVRKYLAGQAIDVTADLERIKVWGISVTLPTNVSVMHKQLQPQ